MREGKVTLSAEDVVFFEDQDNWRYGPFYCTTIFFDAPFLAQDVTNTLLNTERVARWIDPFNASDNLILEFQNSDIPTIGLFVTGSKNSSTYQLSIAPRQFKRLIGVECWEDTKEMNKLNFAALHQELFRLIKAVAARFSIIGATICDETWWYSATPNEQLRVYFHQDYADLIGVPFDNVSETEYFASIDLL